MNKIIRQDELYHYGKKGMKWREKKDKQPQSESLVDKLKNTIDQLFTFEISSSSDASKEQANLFIIEKNNMTLSEILAGGNNKVTLTGFTKIKTNKSQSSQTSGGKVKLQGFRKVTPNNGVEMKGFKKISSSHNR